MEMNISEIQERERLEMFTEDFRNTFEITSKKNITDYIGGASFLLLSKPQSDNKIAGANLLVKLMDKVDQTNENKKIIVEFFKSKKDDNCK